MSHIGGGWGLFLPEEDMCCPEVELSTDIILVSVQKMRRGTLRKLLSEIYPKGASPLRGTTVYVARLNKQGDLRMARPCDTCWKKLKNAGVEYVFYSTDIGWQKERL